MTHSFAASDLFFPGLDDGLAYLGGREAPLTRRPPARVRQMPASESPDLNRKIRQRIDPRWRSPTKPPVFETLSTVVEARQVNVGQRRIKIAGKLLLSAAAGDRVWRAVLNRMDASAEARLVAEIAARQAQADRPMPVVEQRGDRAPFVVDARNGYNFYHFLTETMPQLAVIARVKSRAPIYVHMPDVGQIKGFVRGFIEAIYPKLSRRVLLTDQTRHYDVARLVYNHRHYLYQSSEPSIQAPLARLAPDDPWQTLSADRASRKFLLKSTFDTGMRLLREDALARIEGLDPDGYPRRLWLGRDPDNGDFKSRPNVGEAELLADLRRRGLHLAYLERLTPLEQVATIHHADIIVGPHGAAFAHMIFAHPRALVLEIGTAQTQMHRWGDFLGNAHVARCNYSTLFADVEGFAGEDTVPSIEDGHFGIHIGRPARTRLLEHLDMFAARHHSRDAVPAPA